MTHSAVRSSVKLPLMCSVAGLASANNEAARAVYAASATIPTNMEGIRTFLAPPDGFDALAPADEELAAYGLPPRPDQVTDAAGYRVWAKAMSVHPQRWSGQLTPRHTQGGVARLSANAPATDTAANSAATLATTPNWSGIVHTLPLTSYSATRSF